MQDFPLNILTCEQNHCILHDFTVWGLCKTYFEKKEGKTKIPLHQKFHYNINYIFQYLYIFILAFCTEQYSSISTKELNTYQTAKFDDFYFLIYIRFSFKSEIS